MKILKKHTAEINKICKAAAEIHISLPSHHDVN